MPRRSALPVLLLALAAAACDPRPRPPETAPAPPAPDPVPGGMTAAREAWTQRGPRSYAYTLTVTCFCVQRGEFAAEVRDGRVAAVRDPATGQPVPQERTMGVITVDQLFERMVEAARQSTPVTAAYDPRLGYPTEAEIGTLANDAGTRYTIRDLRPL